MIGRCAQSVVLISEAAERVKFVLGVKFVFFQRVNKILAFHGEITNLYYRSYAGSRKRDFELVGNTPMLREQLNSSMKDAMRAKEERALATIRLILAALKDRDIAARGNGNQDGIEEPEILSLLQTMIKQRNESIRMYEEGGRLELAEQEREEIEVIERFMPKQLDGGELETAVNEAIKEIGAADMKDMGRTMALLKERYPGRMDFSNASGLVRAVLA